MKGKLTFIINIYNMMHTRKHNPNFTCEVAVCNYAITVPKRTAAMINNFVKTSAYYSAADKNKC